MIRRTDPGTFAEVALSAAILVLVAIVALLVFWPRPTRAQDGPTVGLIDAAGGQIVLPGGEACGIAARGEGLTPGTGIDSAVLLETGQALDSFHDTADSNGVWRGKSVYPVLLGPLAFQWRDSEGHGGAIPFTNLCTSPPSPEPLPSETVAAPATPRLTLPPTDTED